MKRMLLTAVAVVLAMTVAACGTGSNDTTYAPAAYGQNGQCYYVDSPDEATALLTAGLCPAGWVAYPAPLAWRESYYPYYSSPAYYNTYVIASRRTVYVGHETTFHTTYSRQINAASKTATYKGSNGKTVSGSKVDTAKMKFSTGSGSTGKVGGGSLRSGTSGGSTGGTGGGSGGSRTTTTVKPKTGGSIGGGSLRGRK